MRKRLLLGTLTVVALVAVALFGLIGSETAVGAGQSPVAGTLEIEGLTPANEPIDVLAWSWGASQTGIVGGGGGGSGAGKVNFQDLHFTKAMDELSPEIVRALATGEHFQEATLLVNADGLPGKPTHRFEFDTLILTSYQTGGSGGSASTDNVSFNFGTVRFTNE